MKMSRCALAVGLALVSSVALAVVPEVSDGVKTSIDRINQDPVMQKMLKELMSEENAKFRFNTHMEVTRIASPSRFEMRRAEELTKRLTQEWGFDPKDVMTEPGGQIKGAGIQLVDGEPVYNVCVRIPGSYAQQKGAQSYTSNPDGSSQNTTTGKYTLESEGKYIQKLTGDNSIIITINPDDSDDSNVSYVIVKLTSSEMAWQKVGTTYSEGRRPLDND